MTGGSADERLHRTSYSLYFPLVAVILALLLASHWLARASAGGGHGFVLAAIVALVLAAYFGWLARSSVTADPSAPALVVRNRLCTWVIPWRDVAGVHVVHSRCHARIDAQRTSRWLWWGVEIRMTDGRSVRCEGLRTSSLRRASRIGGAFEQRCADGVRPAGGGPPPAVHRLPPWTRPGRLSP